MVDLALNTFSNGEVSPQLDARTDIEKYAASCRQLVNMLPLVYGTVTRTPGTQFVAKGKLTPANVRLIPFVYSQNIAYVCEFGNLYIRFYYQGAQLQVGGTPVEVVTPYLVADLPSLQFRQVGETMWLVHSDYAPMQLELADVAGVPTFTLTAITFTNGPFYKRNDLQNPTGPKTTLAATFPTSPQFDAFEQIGSTGTLTAGATWTAIGTNTIGQQVYFNFAIQANTDIAVHSYVPNGSNTILTLGTDYSVTFTAGATTGNYITFLIAQPTANYITIVPPVFYTGHVGSLWALTLPQIPTQFQCPINATNATTAVLLITGTGTLQSSGIWGAVVTLQRSDDDGATWIDIQSWTGTYSGGTSNVNILFSFVEDAQNVFYRAVVSGWTGGVAGAMLTLVAQTSDITGVVQITSITSTTIANVTLTEPLGVNATATPRWAEGSWSAYRGFPAAVGFFQDRIIYGGSAWQPQAVWFSASDDYQNFEAGVEDADSFEKDMLATDTVLWLDSLDCVCVGTSGGEWVVTAGAVNGLIPTTLTGNNAVVIQIGTDGVMPLMPTKAGQAVLFVDYVGRKLREFAFNGAAQKYAAPDMSQMAEHITLGGITQTALQKNPDQILWCVRGDGTLLSFTYERDQNVTAWARHYVGTTLMDKAISYYGATFNEAVASIGPYAWWQLGEASGTIAYDQEKLNNGAYVGPPTLGVTGLVPGSGNTAVTFSGGGTKSWAEGYWSTSPNLTTLINGQGVSVSAWFKTSDKSSGTFTIFDTITSAGNFQISLTVASNGMPTFCVTDDANKQCFVTADISIQADVRDGNTHCLTGVWNGSNSMLLFLDGYGIASITAMQYPSNSACSIDAAFNGNVSGPLWYWNICNRTAGRTATIDEVVVYPFAIGYFEQWAWWQTGLGRTGSKVVSVAVIPGAEEDEVWLAVYRTLGGEVRTNTPSMCIERMASRLFNGIADSFFVNCGTQYSGNPATVIAVPSVLNNEAVQILADGVVQPSQVVSSNQITLSTQASTVAVGFGSQYIVEPMRLQVPSRGGGASQGSKVAIAELDLSFLNSGNVQYGNDLQHLFPVQDTTGVCFTGDTIVTTSGGFDSDTPITITGTDPLPCTLRAIVARAEKTSR